MNKIVFCSLLIAGMLLSARAQSNTAAQAAMSFTFGASDAPIQAVYAEIAATPAKEYPSLEARLLAAVKAQPKLSPEAVKLASDVLRLTGSTACLPLLTEWLASPETAPAALRALGGIRDSSADAALLGLLKTSDGDVRLGLLNALAARGNAALLPQAKAWAGGTDDALAVAALRALGSLGTPDAVAALQALKPAAAARSGARTEALVACANSLKAREAAKLCRALLAGDEPPELKAAALARLVALDAEAALPDVLAALNGKDLYLARLAAGFTGQIKGSKASKSLLAALPALPQEVRLALVTALGLRGDDSVVPALLALAAAEGDEALRLAALEAVGKLGSETPVEALLTLSDQTGAIGRGAMSALSALRPKAVDAKLISLLIPDDVARLKNVVSALSNRACTDATPKLLALAKGDNAEVRLTALRGLRGTATPAVFPELAALLPKASADDLAALAAALWIAADDAETYGLRFMKVWQTVEGAAPALRVAVLGLAARASAPEALEVVKKQMADSDKGVATAAQRALFAWQNESCVAFCMELAKTTADARIKAQALETVAARLDRRDVRLDKKQKLAILDEALKLNPEKNTLKRIEKAIESIKK
jgi:HEAT repeat protein